MMAGSIVLSFEIGQEDFDTAAALILVQDGLAAERAAVKGVSEPLRDFARSAIAFGFERHAVKRSISMAMVQFNTHLDTMEKVLKRVEENSPMLVDILKSELISIRRSVEDILRTTEAHILEAPDIDKQLLTYKLEGDDDVHKN